MTEYLQIESTVKNFLENDFLLLMLDLSTYKVDLLVI